MTIVYLHQYFKLPTEEGGTRSYDLARGFSSLGHDVRVLTTTSDVSRKNGSRWKDFRKDGILISYIYISYGNHLSYLKRVWVFFQFLWFATFKLLKIKCDAVLATSTPLTIGIPALLKKFFHKTPYIFEVRDLWPEAVVAIGAVRNRRVQRLLYGLEDIIYRNAEAIVPLSVDMKRSIVYRYPLLISKPIEVIENISEIKRFQCSHNDRTFLIESKIGFRPKKTILYAGTFGKVNELSYVIDLAGLMQSIDPDITFILIGSGGKKEEVRNYGNTKGVLGKNVFILNSVSKKDLPQYYFEAGMGSSFVANIEELWANSANKFFDTLAAGRPVLINYNGWQKDFIENFNVGYVLPAVISMKDAETFADYLNNGKLHEEQQKNALLVAKKYFSLEMAVRKYNKVLNEIGS